MHTEVMEGYRLSAQQLYYWRLLESGNELRVQCAVLLEGPLKPELLKVALQHLVDRHEVLRTSFHPADVLGGSLQAVAEHCTCSLAEIDLSAESLSVAAAVERAWDEEAERAFDYQQSSLLHAKLVRVAPAEHLLVLALPALCADARTMGNLMKEFASGYEAELAGRDQRNEQIVQYADYAQWQEELREGTDGEQGKVYWNKQRAASSALRLGVEQSEGESAKQEKVQVWLSGVELEEAVAGAAAVGVSIGTMMQAAWHALLWRRSGKDEIEVEVSFDGRTFEHLDKAVGSFARHLPVSCSFENYQFREVAQLLDESMQKARAQQHHYLGQNGDAGAIESSSRVGFEYQIWPAAQRAGDVLFTMVGLTGSREPFKLNLICQEQAQGIRIELQYDARVYVHLSAKRLLEEYLTLLMDGLRQPQALVKDLQIVGEAELAEVLYTWNETARDYRSDLCLQELFEEQVARTPQAAAIREGERELSYQQVNEQANQLAHRLRALGVGPEVVVGICLERSAEMVLSMLAVLKAGGAYLPLEPSYPQERLAFMLEDAQVQVVLTRTEAADLLPVFWGQTICLDESEPSQDWSTDNLEVLTSADNLAYVIYTSGSSGRPKGVSVTHRGVVNYLSWTLQAYELAAGHGSPLHSSLSFDLSVTSVYPALLAGQTVEVLGEGEGLWGLAAAWGAGRDYCLVKLTPGQLQVLAAGLGAGEKRGGGRVLIVGGEQLMAACVQEWLAEVPGLKIYNEYGPTETVVGCCVYEAGSGMARTGNGSVPIGRPINNTQLYLMDEKLRPVPVGVPGELYIGGAGLSRGYLQRPELTAERFIPHSFSAEPGARLYRTGDEARYLADGNLEYLGRLDEQVKVRGYRIELGEIEAVLQGHGQVRECVVLVVEATAGEQELVAYVVSEHSGGAGLDPELRAWLATKLPQYMLPTAIVEVEKIPLKVNGKVDREVLLRVERGEPRGPAEAERVGSASEEIVANLFAEVLGREVVGVGESFFELGGHSLLATRLVSRVREVFQVELKLQSVFEAPTVRGLAGIIDEELRSEPGLRLPAIERVSRAQELPLSFAQQRLYFMEQWEPGSIAYNTPLAVELKGVLKLEALEQSLTEIVRRHEVLRTCFQEVEGRPQQVISEPEPVSIKVESLAGIAAEEREERAQELAGAEARQSFDLGRGPLLRVKLLEMGAEHHVLLLTLHHIVSDGWSLGVLVREVGALYRAYAAGEESPLEELAIQYADFAVWQRQWLQGAVLEGQLEYWRRQLGGELPALELATDRVRPAVQSQRGALQAVSLSESLSGQLKELSRREGVTLFMLLLAGWQTLLFRYTGQQDVVVGTDIANRNQGATEGLIGFFVNQLVLRTDLSGEPSFRELLKRVREVCLGAYAHQDVPFEKLVEELQPERQLARSPLFQVKLVLQNTPIDALELPGLELRGLLGDSTTAQFDLTLSVLETGSEMQGVLLYSTDLFDRITVQRLGEHFKTLLANIWSDVERPISQQELMTPAERRQVLIDWNQTAMPHRKRNVQALFEEQVERTPEGVAIAFEDQEITYADLNSRANQLAHHLGNLGVGVEVLVAVCMAPSIDMVIGLLGIVKAGAAYLPLDPAYPQERLSYMLDDAQVAVLITQSPLLESLPAHWGHTICLDSDWESFDTCSSANPPILTAPDNLAYVIYTSGSTGMPKGVQLHHAGLSNLVAWHHEAYQISEVDQATLLANVAFDASVWELWPYLTRGATLHIVPEEIRSDAVRLMDWLNQRGVSICFLPTPLAEAVMLSDSRADTSLRVVLTGGDKLHRGVGEGLGFRLVNHYGPTEGTVVATAADVEQKEEGQFPHIGKPIGNTEVYILDQQQLALPRGIPGEICIGGMGLARGYWQRPDLTAERFIPNPFGSVAGTRLYRTGDRARFLEDGSIEFLGRLDTQVKVRGYRIELGEIEAVLMHYEAVRECLVLTVKNEREEVKLVAYVVADTVNADLERQMRAYLEEKLPGYMVPVIIVLLDEFPLTANGKVDRRALLLQADQAATHQKTENDQWTPIEELIGGVFAEVLGNEQVTLHESFFDLGGHSLLATQLLSRVRDICKVELPLRALFESPSVAGLSKAVELALSQGQSVEAPPISPAPRTNELPLSFAQQRLWFLDRWEPGSTAYNIPLAVELKGMLEVAALEQALNEIVRRHEVLRTRFIEVDGRAQQVISEAEYLSIKVESLTALAAEERETLAQELAREEAQQNFDLARGPLMRVKLLELALDHHLLLLSMHHIISDGWSLGILVRELTALYDAFIKGEPSPLGELPIQYADYAVWQREWLRGEALEAQLSYWRCRLEGAPPSLELPTDFPRTDTQLIAGAAQSITLPAELVTSLKALGRREGATLYMVLLAGFKLLLLRYTNQTDVIVGTPIAGRRLTQLEDLIGFFVNTLVLCTDLSGDPIFIELLARVRETCLGAYAHQDVPFERLVDELQPERSLSRTPLFQVMFVLHNAPQGDLRLPGLTVKPLAAESDSTKFDLSFSATEFDGQLVCHLQYKTALFETATAARMLAHFEALLRAAAANPEARAAALPYLTEREEQLLLRGWNETFSDYPREDCVHELFERQAARTPDAVAVQFEEERLTYAELNASAERLARRLQASGVGPETFVGLLTERTPRMVAGLLAILKAGGAYVPLDPSWPKERLALILADAPVLLTERHLVAGLPEYDAHLVLLDSEGPAVEEGDKGDGADVGQSKGADETQGDGVRAARACPENAAYVIYTSGSTGRPKGVVVEHRQIVNYVRAVVERVRFEPEMSFAMVLPLTVDSSQTVMFPAFFVGGTIHLVSRERATDPAALAEYFERETVDCMKIAPSYLAALQTAARPERLMPRRRLVLGGEASRREWVEGLARLAPDCAVFNHYGPTEATVGMLVYKAHAEEVPRPTHLLPIGLPLANTKAYVLDKQMRPVAVGVSGELYIGGQGVARGYLNRPATAENFVPDPYSSEPGARLYKTGDVVRRLSDGNLLFIGRDDHQVKIRGFRIELGEIEAVIRHHVGVGRAVVIAREETSGDRRLVGYVVPLELGQAEELRKELREYLREKLPDYMVPSALVVLDSLPLSANGKLDVRRLPAPDAVSVQSEGYVAPRNEAELRLACIWEELLGVRPVSVNDNFFELGGDSILSLQIVSRARAAGLQLTPKQVFQYQTLGALAQQAESAAQEVDQGITTQAPGAGAVGEQSGVVPFTPIQRQFFRQQRPEPSHYNMALLLKVPAGSEVEQLRQAMTLVVQHHEALRLRFREVAEGEWEQWLAECENNEFVTHYELEGLTEAEQRQQLEATAEQLQRSLNLEAGPLLRVAYFSCGERAGRLLVIVHHLVVDGVSWRILLEDLAAARAQLAAGKEAGAVELPARTTSYQQWARQLQQYAGSGALQEEVEYWQEVAAAARRQGGVEHEAASAGGTQQLRLSREQTRALLQQVPEIYHTQIQEVLLTALGRAWERWSGRAQVVVEMEGHGREEVVEGLDLTRTVGWFTSLYPVVLRSRTGEERVVALKRVKEQLRSVPQRGIGYGVLKELSESAELREQLKVESEVRFNYLGQFDQVVGEQGVWEHAGESVGQLRGESGGGPEPLTVTALVGGGQLQVNWAGANVGVGAMAELVQSFEEELLGIIEDCASGVGGGYTPSDFPHVQLSQAQVDQVTLGCGEVEDIYRLTAMQEGLLFHTLYAPQGGPYYVQVSYEIEGVLSVQWLKEAWQQVVARHEVLRSSFVWEGLTEPLQVVQRRVPLTVKEYDWRELATAEQVERLRAHQDEERREGFALGEAPLLKLSLMRLGEQRYYLNWSHHHLVLDGWCSTIVLQEVFACYEALRHEQPVTLPRRRPYRSYVEWLQRQDLGAAEQYWRQRLRGFGGAPALPLSRPGAESGAAAGRYAEREVKLSEVTTARLKAVARSRHLTLNTLVQGAWALLLSRYCGEEDIVFGITMSGRPVELPGVEQMVGLFINTLPLRVEVAAEQPVWSWLAELQQQQAEMHSYEYGPLVQVLGWSEVERGAPLFESIFVFENYPIDRALKEQLASISSSLKIKQAYVISRTNYPLTVSASPADELNLTISYDEGLFEPDTIERMLGYLELILGALAANEDQSLSGLPLMTAAERQQLLTAWNDTAAPYPAEQTVAQLFEAQVVRTPQATAIREGEHELSYQQVNEQANQLAHQLRALGVGPEVVVGICLERSTDTVLSMLAVLKAGGAYLPLEPSYPQERLAFMLEDAQVQVLLTRTAVAQSLPPRRGETIYLDEREPGWSTENLEALTSAENLAYVIYTSGSSGQPKGVSVTQRGLMNYLSWTLQTYELAAGYGSPLHSSLSFDLSVTSVYPALLVGQTVEVLGEAEGLWSLAAAWSAGRDYSLVKLTPGQLQVLAAGLGAGEKRGGSRVLVVGGEQLMAASVQEWLTEVPGLKIYNEYGPTETVVGCCVYEAGSGTARTGNGSVAIGRPINNTQLYLLDGKLQPVPVGVAGELYIGGAGLARGYLQRPELTAERFIPHPFSAVSGARLYRTGDEARYLADGNLEYLGRLDKQVKVHGYRIELGELEAVLQGHPSVRKCVVLAVATAAGEQELVAYVSSRKLRKLSYTHTEHKSVQHLVSEQSGNAATWDQELRAWLATKLPQYMIPAAFVTVEKIPLKVNGKVDREALLQVERGEPSEGAAPERASSASEEIVANLFAEVLGRTTVGIAESFFGLGGHSLLATRLVSRVRKVFQVELKLQSVFEAPTVRGLAGIIDEELRSESGIRLPEIERVSRAQELPLSFAQQRLYFIEQLEPGSIAYNIALAVELTGELKVAALEQVLNEIVRRHEVLRTRFSEVAGRAQQVITEPAPLSIEVESLAGLAAAEREERAQELARAEAQQSFDLGRGPLLRVKLLELAVDQHVLLLTMHHIVSDGWSMGVLVREVGALYRAYAAGEESPLAELAIQYADFAVWQRQWLQGAVLEGQLEYWRRQLGGELPVLELATDRVRPAVQSQRGALQTVSLSEELSGQLKELSRREGVTLFMLLLAAWQTLLFRYTGQPDVIVGTDIANRNQGATEGLIGFFVNQLVMRTDLSGEPSFRELLKRVREVCLGAYAHQDVPFEKLVEELQPERQLARAPLFQVKLVLQNNPIDPLELPGLQLRVQRQETNTAKLDMILTLAEGSDRIGGQLEYNTDLFDAATIEQMMSRFSCLLQSIADSPDSLLEELEFLTESERLQQATRRREREEIAISKLIRARRQTG